MRRRFWLHEDIVIDKLITFSYSELARDYVYPGEKHDFWEFLYLDKGEVDIITDSGTFYLKQGDLVFYSPNESHALEANNRNAPNIMIVSFECQSPAMNHFTGKYFQLNDQERALISGVLREGLIAFDPPIDKKWKRGSPGLERMNPPPFGSEQLIKLYLEMLMISLIRKEIGFQYPLRRLPPAAHEHSDEQLVRHLIAFLQEQVGANLTMADICQHFNSGESTLRTLFKQEIGVSIMEYYNMLKIEKAKSLIRERDFTYTEIADQLGYSSVHYFSRHFKKTTDMTPSEYERSLRK